MKSNQKPLVCPGLSTEVLENISSRAKYLSRQFWELEYEDLCQDGIVLVLEIRGRIPTCTDLYLFGAINKYYSGIMKDAVKYKTRRRDIDDESPFVDPMEIETKMDRNLSKTESKDVDTSVSVELIKEYGLSKKEHKELLGSNKALRRKGGNNP
jgi:hypothetical protein